MTQPKYPPRARDSTPLLPLRLPPLPSNAWIYPIYGILYLPFHPPLLKPFLTRVIPLLLISLLILAVIFTFLYLPQVALLAFFHGPLAWVNAAFMCLSEAAAILQLIAESCLTEREVVETFDAVLLEEAEKIGDLDFKVRIWDMLSTARDLHLSQPDSLGKLGEHKVSPYLKFSCRLTLEFLIELPLNLIPVVGSPLFLALQAYHLGPLAHYRYFQLQGMNKKSRSFFIKQNRLRYWLFGLVHVHLQLIPVLSIFFLFTSATGAALWAFEREKRMREKDIQERRRRSIERAVAVAGPSFEAAGWSYTPVPGTPGLGPAFAHTPVASTRGWRSWFSRN